MRVQRKATLEGAIRRLSRKGIAAAATPLGGEGTPWAAPAFQNSWANYEAAGTFATAAYRKGADGRVTLRGLVKHAAATGNSVIFTLPAGFRPSKQLIFACWAQTGGGATVGPIRVDVTSAGEIVASAPAASTDYLSLNLSFYPD